MEITKIIIMLRPYGCDGVILDTTLDDPRDPSVKAGFSCLAPRFQGEAWAKAQFPGVPVEVIKTYGKGARQAVRPV